MSDRKPWCSVCNGPEHYLPTCEVFKAEARAVSAIEDREAREKAMQALVKKVWRLGRQRGWGAADP